MFPGGHSGGATPGPIPNPEVKPSNADDTAWAAGWESRTLPGANMRVLENRAGEMIFSPIFLNISSLLLWL